MKRLLAHTAEQRISLVLHGSGAGIRFALAVLAARILTQHGYGVFELGLAIGLFATNLSNLGLSTLLLQRLPDQAHGGEPARAAAESVWAWQAVAVASLLIGAAFLALGHVFGVEWAPVAAPVVVGWAVATVSIDSLRATEHIAMAYAPVHVGAPLLVTVGLYFVYSTDQRATPVAVATALGVGYLLVSGLQEAYLYRDLINQESGETGIETAGEQRPPLWGGAVFALSQLGLSAAHVIDIYLAGVVLGYEAAAVYAASTRLARLVMLPTAAVLNALPGEFGKWKALGVSRQMQRQVSQSARAATVAATFTAMAVVGLANWLLQLFGEDYSAGGVIVGILAISHVVNAMTGPAVHVLNVSGEGWSVTRIVVMAAVVQAVLGTAGALTAGIVGLALGTAAAAVAANISLAIAAERKTGLRCWPCVKL